MCAMLQVWKEGERGWGDIFYGGKGGKGGGGGAERP